MSVILFLPNYLFSLRTNRPEDFVRPSVPRDQPSYDVEKTGDRSYRITLAVPGFAVEDLAVTTRPNELVVVGKQVRRVGDGHLRRGVVSQAFERSFTLGDNSEVTGASLVNGLLTIDLEERSKVAKPRTIGINDVSSRPSLVERLRHVTTSARGAVGRWLGRGRARREVA